MRRFLSSLKQKEKEENVERMRRAQAYHNAQTMARIEADNERTTRLLQEKADLLESR
jgi:hypothetical protein